MRDPQALGERYLAARKAGLAIEVAVLLPAPERRGKESCIDKYGRADEIEPRWEEVQTR